MNTQRGCANDVATLNRVNKAAAAASLFEK
jgi:hypothetical protein